MAGEALDRLARCLRRRQAECPPRGPPAPACSRTCASVGSPRCANGRHRLESVSLHGRERPPRKPFPPGVPGPSQSRVRGDLSGCVRRPDVISPFTKLLNLESQTQPQMPPTLRIGAPGIRESQLRAVFGHCFFSHVCLPFSATFRPLQNRPFTRSSSGISRADSTPIRPGVNTSEDPTFASSGSLFDSAAQGRARVCHCFSPVVQRHR